MRTCSHCKKELPETLKYFGHTNTKYRRGWESWCRACRSAKCAAWCKKHEEDQKAKRLARSKSVV